MAKWTQDQAVAFECARECITDMMGICTAKIDEEEGRASPDAARLAELEQELSGLAKERSSLTINDDDRVATIRTVYGSQIRAYRAQQDRQAA